MIPATESDLVTNFSTVVTGKRIAINFYIKVKLQPTAKMVTPMQKFRGTKFEKELDALFDNEIISLCTSAKEVYKMCPLFREMEPKKFANHYYAWRRRIGEELEKARTKGKNPPTGTSI